MLNNDLGNRAAQGWLRLSEGFQGLDFLSVFLFASLVWTGYSPGNSSSFVGCVMVNNHKVFRVGRPFRKIFLKMGGHPRGLPGVAQGKPSINMFLSPHSIMCFFDRKAKFERNTHHKYKPIDHNALFQVFVVLKVLSGVFHPVIENCVSKLGSDPWTQLPARQEKVQDPAVL